MNTAFKTCENGHSYYSGKSCPVCDFFGEENMKDALKGEEKDGNSLL